MTFPRPIEPTWQWPPTESRMGARSPGPRLHFSSRSISHRRDRANDVLCYGCHPIRTRRAPIPARSWKRRVAQSRCAPQRGLGQRWPGFAGRRPQPQTPPESAIDLRCGAGDAISLRPGSGRGIVALSTIILLQDQRSLYRSLASRRWRNSRRSGRLQHRAW